MFDAVQQNMLVVLVCLAALAVIVAAILTIAVTVIRNKTVTQYVRNERMFCDEWDKLSGEVRILIDSKSHIPLFVSGDSYATLGIPLETLRADEHALQDCLDADNRHMLKKAMLEWDGTTPLTVEFDFTNLNTNKPRFGILHITPDNASGCFVVVFRDITAEKIVRDNLEREREEAITAEQAKSDFLSSMSHEIRTPMNGILGMLSLTKSNVTDKDKVLDYANQAENLSQYLLSLINDILDMSKIESGKLEIEQRPFNIKHILEREDELFRKQIEEKGVRLEVSCDPEAARYVLGDEMRIIQVMSNLVSNAYKFTKEGFIAIRCKLIQSDEETIHFMLEVQDTGKGMSPEFLDNIFNPFTQEDSSVSRQFGGSGLGMSITDNLVRLMNGQIVVESEVDKGSLFRVYLGMPLATAEQVQMVKEQDAGKRDARGRKIEPFSLKGCNILLAEDNAINVMVAQQMLSDLGAVVDVAHDGVEAVEKFEASAPDTYGLILMDIQMPRMDGREAARRIRALNRPDAARVPLFALSANSYVEDIRNSKAAGMTGHLVKPVDFANIESIIAKEMME